jgi:hypothetical protein
MWIASEFSKLSQYYHVWRFIRHYNFQDIDFSVEYYQPEAHEMNMFLFDHEAHLDQICLITEYGDKTLIPPVSWRDDGSETMQ